MLDMGFIRDIRKIIAKLPTERQTLLFSATMPREIAELAGEMLRDPARVAVTPVASTAERIAQRVIHTDRASKPALLADVLRSEKIERALVFTRTKHGADRVVRSLAKDGIAAEAIHGNKTQGQRERVMANFRAGRIQTLIATDIAARGIDVDGVSHVINYDLPNIPESYVHRIGRTARAGAEGIAISFCDAEEAAFLRDIERLIRMSIPATGEPARTRGPQRQHKQAPRNGQAHRGGPRHGKPHGEGARNGKAHAGARNGHGPESHGGKNNEGGQRRRKRHRPGGDRNEPAVSHAAHNGDIAGVGFMQRRDRSHPDQRGSAQRAPR
jgi:superfamily II DNA/RNA helicase